MINLAGQWYFTTDRGLDRLNHTEKRHLINGRPLINPSAQYGTLDFRKSSASETKAATTPNLPAAPSICPETHRLLSSPPEGHQSILPGARPTGCIAGDGVGGWQTHALTPRRPPRSLPLIKARGAAAILAGSMTHAEDASWRHVRRSVPTDPSSWRNWKSAVWNRGKGVFPEPAARWKTTIDDKKTISS